MTAMTTAQRGLVGTAVGCCVAATAAAGPIWCESLDAGSLPPTAQKTLGGGPLFKIMGSLTGIAPGPPDFQDMYLVYIVDPVGFAASTSPADGGATAFNSQLWLFRVDPFDCDIAFGLLANDDISPIDQDSRIQPLSTDGSGAMLVAPGYYYIAISGGPADDPLGAGGLIFDQIFPPEISGPDGPGGADPIVNWTGGAPPEIGPYTIAFPEGTVETANFCCPTDVDRDGVVGFLDLLELLASWGECFGCRADLDGNGQVGFDELLAILTTWGPCPDG